MNPDGKPMDTVNHGMQLNGHRHSLDSAHGQAPVQCPPMQHRLPAAHLRDPVAGLVQTKDSLTIYKAHLFRLSTVECFHEIIHQQAWIRLIQI